MPMTIAHVSCLHLIFNTLRLTPFVLTKHQLLGQGLHVYTWKTVESADFVEHASYLVCDDLHRNLGVVQSNFREICNIAASWSENGQLDVFSPRDSSKSFSMDKLQEQHRSDSPPPKKKNDLWKIN